VATSIYYPRDAFSAAGVNQAGLDFLERLKTLVAALEAASPGTDDDGEPIDLSDILARLAAVETLAALAKQIAEEAPLWIRPQLTVAQILAITDDALKVPSGDWFFTPAGDRLLMPSA
jgi:hypothetical protein